MVVVFSGLRVQSSYFNLGTVFFHFPLSYSLSASLPSSSNKHYSFLITHFTDEKTEVWASSWDFPGHMAGYSVAWTRFADFLTHAFSIMSASRLLINICWLNACSMCAKHCTGCIQKNKGVRPYLLERGRLPAETYTPTSHLMFHRCLLTQSSNGSMITLVAKVRPLSSYRFTD